MTIAKLGSIALDCADPHQLAEFWAKMLGVEIAYRSEDFVALKTQSIWLATVRDADYEPPT